MERQGKKDENLLLEQMDKLSHSLDELAKHLPEENRNHEIVEYLKDTIKNWKDHLPNDKPPHY